MESRASRTSDQCRRFGLFYVCILLVFLADPGIEQSDYIQLGRVDVHGIGYCQRNDVSFRRRKTVCGACGFGEECVREKVWFLV